MSYTKIYKFNKKGDASGLVDIKNSWRGAMAIWGIMENKYLEPLPKPIWMNDKDYKRGYSRTCQQPSFNDDAPNPMKPIWDLWTNKKVNRIDKIVLGTTFDNVVVMLDNIKETIEAFEKFEGETSLKEQAETLKESLSDKDLIAVAWNQTSVCGDTWTNYNYNEETEESIPYNIKNQDKHWNLFDDMDNN